MAMRIIIGATENHSMNAIGATAIIPISPAVTLLPISTRKLGAKQMHIIVAATTTTPQNTLHKNI